MRRHLQYFPAALLTLVLAAPSHAQDRFILLASTTFDLAEIQVTKAFTSVAMLLSLGAIAAEKHDHSRDGDKYASKTLTVSGWVKNMLVLDVDALRAMPATEFGETPMRCGRPEPKYVVEGYRGVLLRDILAAAGVVDDDVRHSRNYMYVVANATDDYQVVFSLHEIRNTPVGDEILVFYEKNGEPLGTREGLIALVSLADANRCNRHIRWLNSIEVRRHGAAAP